MNQNLSMRRLIWKEARQIWPLLLLLLFLESMLHCILLANRAEYNDPHWYCWLGVPFVYSIGIGLLLIGQEHETNSLQWLRSLPIDPKYIQRSKWMVANLGLLILWVISYLIYRVFHWLSQAPELPSLEAGFAIQNKWNLEIISVLLSFYILQVSVAVSWTFTKTMQGLFVVVLGSTVPLVAVLCLQRLQVDVESR